MPIKHKRIYITKLFLALFLTHKILSHKHEKEMTPYLKTIPEGYANEIENDRNSKTVRYI